MSKSVGGGTATALAEARAAAEARVAERDRKDEEMTIAMGIPTVPEMDAAPVYRNKDVEGRQDEGRLSISDLFPAESRMKEKHKVPEKLFHLLLALCQRRRRRTKTPHPYAKGRQLPPITPLPPLLRFSINLLCLSLPLQVQN